MSAENVGISSQGGRVELSVVVPMHDEEDNVIPLVGAIVGAVLREEDQPFEIILVDDGSQDNTWERIGAAAAASPHVQGIRLARNCGQTAAMMAGFDHVRGEIIVTMDGDLQNDPRDIPALMDGIRAGYDVVCGWRRQRQDALVVRKVPSWVANRIIRALTGVPVRDNGCSLRAYRRHIVERLSLYAEQHRFISSFAATVGARLTEIPVTHHARRFGRSKYGLSRTFRVLIDLVTLKLLTSFRSRPLLAFGLLSFPVATLGVSLLGVTLLSQVSLGHGAVWVSLSAGIVLPTAGILTVSAAVFLIALGLISTVALQIEVEDAPDTPSI